MSATNKIQKPNILDWLILLTVGELVLYGFYRLFILFLEFLIWIA